MRKLFGVILFLLSAIPAFAQTPAGGYASPSGSGGGGLTVVTSLPATCTTTGLLSFNTQIYGCVLGNAPFLMPQGNFPINGTSNVWLDWQLNEASGNTLLDSSGNGHTGTIGTCTAGGTVTRGAAPQGGLVFTNCQNGVTSDVALPANISAIEVLYSYADPGNNPFPGANATVNTSVLFGSTTAAGPFMQFGSIANGAMRTVSGIFSQTFGTPNKSNAFTMNPAGTHMLTWVFDAAHDLYWRDSQLLAACQGSLGNCTTASGGTLPTFILNLGGSSAYQAGFFTGTIYRIRVLLSEPTSGLSGTQGGEFSAMQFAAQQRGITIGDGQSTSTRNMFITNGDSKSEGATQTFPWWSHVNLHSDYLFENQGVGSTALSGPQGVFRDCIPTFAPTLHPLAGSNILTMDWSTNDAVTATLTPVGAYNALLKSVGCAQSLGVKTPIVISMVSETGTNVDATWRDPYNTFVRNGQAQYGYIVADIGGTNHPNSGMGCDGCFANSNFSVGGVHPSDLGGRTISAPIISTVTNRVAALAAQNASPSVYKVGAAMTPTLGGVDYFYLAPGSGTTLVTDFQHVLEGVPPGATVCVVPGIYLGTASVPTDTQTLTYTDITVDASQSTGKMGVYCAPNATGGADTITQTYGGTIQVSGQNALVFYVDGTATVSPVDVVSAAGTGSSTAPLAPSITPAANGELVLGVMSNQGAKFPTLTPSVGFDQRSNFIEAASVSNNGFTMGIESYLQNLAGAIQPGFTMNPTGPWVMYALAFKPGIYGAKYQMRAEDGTSAQNPFVMDCSGTGSSTAQLLDAEGLTGSHVYIVTQGTCGANTMTLAAVNSETVNGAASISLATNSKFDCESVLVSAAAGGNNWVCR